MLLFTTLLLPPPKIETQEEFISFPLTAIELLYIFTKTEVSDKIPIWLVGKELPTAIKLLAIKTLVNGKPWHLFKLIPVDGQPNEEPIVLPVIVKTPLDLFTLIAEVPKRLVEVEVNSEFWIWVFWTFYK